MSGLFCIIKHWLQNKIPQGGVGHSLENPFAHEEVNVKGTLGKMKNKWDGLLFSLRVALGSFFYKFFFLDYALEEKLRMSALDAAISFAVNNQVQGDYLEFGVYKGKSFIQAFRRFKDRIVRHREYPFPRFIAFDSFEGLPVTEEKDSPIQYYKGAYYAPRSEFVRNVTSAGLDESHLVIVPGFYDTSLNDEIKQKHSIQRASVIYIDVDVYESAVPVFDFITSLLQTGTVIVLDEWFRYRGRSDRGLQKACNEWLAKNPHIKLVRLHTWEKVAFIVMRNSASDE